MPFGHLRDCFPPGLRLIARNFRPQICLVRFILHYFVLIFTMSIFRSMASVTWFEVGSLFCGVAPSVKFLIFGRAVAGIGAAGSKLLLDQASFRQLT
jgi:hypothetical protein